MIVKNKSRYPDAEVRRLLDFAFRGIADTGVEVHVGNARGRGGGRAYHGIPGIAQVQRRARRLVTLRIGPPDAFPADNLSSATHWSRWLAESEEPPKWWRDLDPTVRASEQYTRNGRTWVQYSGPQEQTPYGGKTAPLIIYNDWREWLVGLAAHEARHVSRHRLGKRGGEVDAERYAAKRLAAYRDLSGADAPPEHEHPAQPLPSSGRSGTVNTTWRDEPTVAETLNPPPLGSDPDYDRRLANRAARLRRDAAAIEPPPLLDVEQYPDVTADPEFEPAPPGWRPNVASELAEYLAAVEAFVRRYVAFPSEHEPVAVALWVAHAHVVDRLETSPILAVTSAEMRSGKTRLLDCLELLVPNPERAVLPSESVLYTLLSQDPRPTLLIDEADAIFGNRRQAERYEGVRGVLNAGNRKGTTVPRVRLDGRKRGVDRFDVYGPKCIAGIGELPATVADRAIPIRMKRRAPDERVAKFRIRVARDEAALLDVPDVPDVPLAQVPDELPDRAADSWEVLIGLAELAGGSWPARARQAAIALSGEEALHLTVGMRLLADIREVFGEADHLPTSDLLHLLIELDGAPWSDWYGAPLTARGLARLLEPYGLGPAQRRVRGQKSRGYFAAEFADAWRRYVVDTGATGTSGTSGTPFDPELATDDDGEVAS